LFKSLYAVAIQPPFMCTLLLQFLISHQIRLNAF
jgi:hypothetical protein